MANSVDPDQTAPIEAVCSGSMLFASILNLSVMLGNYLQQTTSVDDIFRCIIFLGALRVNSGVMSLTSGPTTYFCRNYSISTSDANWEFVTTKVIYRQRYQFFRHLVSSGACSMFIKLTCEVHSGTSTRVAAEYL